MAISSSTFVSVFLLLFFLSCTPFLSECNDTLPGENLSEYSTIRRICSSMIWYIKDWVEAWKNTNVEHTDYLQNDTFVKASFLDQLCKQFQDSLDQEYCNQLLSDYHDDFNWIIKHHSFGYRQKLCWSIQVSDRSSKKTSSHTEL